MDTLYGPLFLGIDTAMEEAGWDEARLKKQIFSVQLFNYYSALYEIGQTNEQNLRSEFFRPSFKNSFIRNYWRVAYPYWKEYKTDRRSMQFLEIAQDEYTKAMERVVDSESIASDERLHGSHLAARELSRSIQLGITLLVGAAFGVSIGKRLSKRYELS